MTKTALSHDQMVLSQEHALLSHPHVMPTHTCQNDAEAIPVASNLSDEFQKDAVVVADVTTAHIIKSDQEAIEVAYIVADALRAHAAERDRLKTAPYDEVEWFSKSGLWAITVPKEFGGADVSSVTVAQVFEIIAEVDPSIAQIPQNHFTTVDDLRTEGSIDQQRYFFDRILKGDRIGSAFSEAKGKNVRDLSTTISAIGNKKYVVNGEKFYCTGALFAHWLPVLALDEQGQEILAMIDGQSAGLTVVDDWSSFGQRTTASGTVKVENVTVDESRLLYTYRSYTRPTNSGAFAQIMHAAVDAGIAKAAINETIAFVNANSRPWPDAQVARASDDPLTISELGKLECSLHAAEALLERAGRILDMSYKDTTLDNCASASIAVAEAKIVTTEIAVTATNKLFELSGTKSTLEKYDLDRHWRNARTHTLHDPVRWKYYAVGNYYLNGTKPPRHNWI